MAYTYEYPMPGLTTDVIPFAWRKGKLELLLIRRGHAPFRNAWALPGGFLDIDEEVEAGARRELAEETGLTDVELHFLRYADGVRRDPRRRVITLAFVGLVAPGSDARAGDDAAHVGWHEVGALPDLAFDHAEIVADAIALLRDRARRTPLLFGLLPRRFTMDDLHALYEAVYAKPISRRRFAAQISRRGILKSCGARGRTRYVLRRRIAQQLVRQDTPLISCL